MFHSFIIASVCIGIAYADGWGGYGHEFHHAKPYGFSYVAKGHGGESHHHESGIGGKAVKGNYGYTDAKGIHREVHYVADHGGFRAEIKTNEPGTAPKDPAHVKMHAAPHHGHGWHGHGLGGPYGGWGGHHGHHGLW